MIVRVALGLLPRLEYTERSRVLQCALNSSYECHWQVQHPIPEEKERKRMDDNAIKIFFFQFELRYLEREKREVLWI